MSGAGDSALFRDEPPGPWRHGFATGAGGVRIHYVEQLPTDSEEGGGDDPHDAPLAVLLHGFPEFWWSWRLQIAALAADGYHVVAPDLRGYNLSDKPEAVEDYDVDLVVEDVRRLIADRGHERAVIVGHDWGGAVAWQFAMTHPEAVERLIVLNAPHPARMAEAFSGRPNLRQLGRSWYVFVFQIPRLPERWLAVNNYERIGLIFRDSAAHPEAFPPDVLQHYRKAAARPGALAGAINYYRAAMRRSTQDGSSRLRGRLKPLLGGVLPHLFDNDGEAEAPPERSFPRISAPTLLLWGERDTALGRELTEGMDPLFSGPFEVLYLPDCGHWVQQECPEDVNRFLREFLDRYSGG